MIVFPAVDIQGGKAVRLRRGDFDDVTVFSDDPVELARFWQSEGAEALHVIDLDAARTGELTNFKIVEDIVKALDIPVQYGGGIRTPKSLAFMAGIGVHWVVMGTAAVTALDLLDDAVNWLGDRLVVGLDCTDGMVATHGWQQRSQMSAIRMVKLLAEHGVTRVVYTDTDRDGMLGGPNLPGLADLAEVSQLEIILSGGIGLLDDLRRLKRLDAEKVVGVIVGRALYEKAFTLPEALARLRQLAPTVHRKRIIPCLDVRDGRVVKGINFVSIRDAGDPVELAARYDAEGADELIFLDITASHERRDIIIDLAARCAEEVFIPFTIGGGLSSVDDVRAILAAGADKVTMNTAAVAGPGARAPLLGAVRRAVHRGGHRRTPHPRDRGGGAPAAVGGLRPRRAHAHRHRRDRVGGARGRAGRRRVHAHQHGPRRHARRLRPGAHARGGARRGRAGHRLRRRRHARAPRRRAHRRRGRRRAGREHLPLRHLQHRARPRSSWPRGACRCGRWRPLLIPQRS